MVLSQSATPHDVASRHTASRSLTATPLPWVRTPRQPTNRRPRAGGPPASNLLSDPLPVRHVLTTAAQRCRRCTRAKPPLVGDWPPRVAAHPAVPRPCRACTASPLALVCKGTICNASNSVINFSGAKASLLFSSRAFLVIRTSRYCWNSLMRF
jgi:hypothetical protein